MTEYPVTTKESIIGEPVFICGHAKSGTTLLSTLLDGHPQILVFPEETFYLNYINTHQESTVEEAVNWLLDQITRRYPSEENLSLADRWSFPYFHSIEAFQKRFLAHLESAERPGHVLESLIQSYAEETDQQGKRYWVEKTHANETHLRLLLNWYGEVRAIYIVRDPRDIYVSWAKRMNASDKSDAIENFIYRWGMSVWAWRQYTAKYSQGLMIRFEDLLQYPDHTLRYISHFLDVDYEPIMERPTKNGQLWQGNSMHGDMFTGISTEPIGRWHQKLDAEDLNLIEAYLGKTMRSFGYQLENEPVSLSEAFAFWLRLNRNRTRILGMLVRLYWPFRLPKRLRIRTE